MFPSRHECARLLSSSSTRHGAQLPAASRVVKDTAPEPRQCSATMLKRGAAACSDRVACSGTSRIVSVGPPAKAVAGATRAAVIVAKRSFIGLPQGAMPPSAPE